MKLNRHESPCQQENLIIKTENSGTKIQQNNSSYNSKTGDVTVKRSKKEGYTVGSLDNSQVSMLPMSDNSRQNEKRNSQTISTSNLKKTVIMKKKIIQEDQNLKNYLNNLGKQMIEDEKDFLNPGKKSVEVNNNLNKKNSASQNKRKSKNNINSTTIMTKFNQFLLLERLGIEKNQSPSRKMNLNEGIFPDKPSMKSMSPVKKPLLTSIKRDLSGDSKEVTYKRNSIRKVSTELNFPITLGKNAIVSPSGHGLKESLNGQSAWTNHSKTPLSFFPKKSPKNLETYGSLIELRPEKMNLKYFAEVNEKDSKVDHIGQKGPHKLQMLEDNIENGSSKDDSSKIKNDSADLPSGGPNTNDEDEEERHSLKKFNNVYDSLEDGENEEGNLELLMDDYSEEDPWVFSKNSIFLKRWSSLIFLLILYSVIVSPYIIAFDDYGNSVFGYLDLAVDIIFTTDVVLNFFSPYYDYEGEVVTNHKMIIFNYLSTWFTLDFLSSFPIGVFTELTNDIGTTTNKVGSLKKFIRISRLYRLTKWLKIFRLLKLAKRRDHHSELSSLQFIKSLETNRMVVFSFLFIIVIHVSNCLWIYIGKINDTNVNWIYSKDFLDYDNFALYISGLYFIICTVCSIGYGDITSVNTGERIYNTIFMIIGVVLFSFWLSSLSSLFSKLDAKALNLQSKLRILEDIKKEYKIPQSLLDKIKKTISHEVKKTNIERYEFIETLPTSIKNEIFLIMHKHHIKQLQFFKMQPHDFILYVLPLFKPLPITKGETLFSIGEFVEEMYLVVKGNLSLNMGTIYDYIEIAQIREGNHIGDVLLYLHEQSPYDLKCKTDNSEVLVIKRNDFYKIKMHFNQNILFILQTSMKRMELFEKRRYLVQHFRKFEVDSNLISQKMKTLNIMLMHKDFDDYYYNEGELQDINDFIESMDDDELMKILGIDESKIKKITRMKSQINLMKNDDDDRGEVKDREITIVEPPKESNRQENAEKEANMDKHVKFNIASESSGNTDTVDHLKVRRSEEPRVSCKSAVNNYLTYQSPTYDSSHVNSCKNFSAKLKDDSSIFLMPEIILNKTDNINSPKSRKMSSKFNSKKNSEGKVEIAGGSSKKNKIKDKKSDKLSKVKKIVNEILLVNQWRRGFGGFSGNENIVNPPENPIDIVENLDLTINNQNLSLSREKSHLGELNFDIIKNELKINEKAGNLIDKVGDNLHIQKIKSEIEELGNTKKTRRKSISILNNLTNNLVEANKLKTKDKFVSSKNLTLIPSSKTNDRSSNSKLNIPGKDELKVKNNTVEEKINKVIMSSSKNINKDSNFMVEKVTQNNQSININFYQLETNYNQNYIFFDDKKKAEISQQDFINSNKDDNLPSPTFLTKKEPATKKKVSNVNLNLNSKKDMDMTGLAFNETTNNIDDITIHSSQNNNTSLINYSFKANPLLKPETQNLQQNLQEKNPKSTKIDLSGKSIFKYAIEKKKIEKGYKKLDRLYYLMQKMNECK